MRHKTAVRASGRRCLSIANLMKLDGLLLKSKYLSDPRAHQPIIPASECKVNESMQRSIQSVA